MRTSLMATPISTMALVRLLLFASLLSLEMGFAFEGSLSSERHHRHPTHHKIHVNSLMSSTVCSPSSKGHDKKRASLEVVYKYGPCSPLKHYKTNPPSQAEILAQDESYVAAIQSRIAKSEGINKATIPIRAGSRNELGNYVVKVGLGSPKKDLSFIFGTGIDLSWTQCQPCSKNCFGQYDPLFNPRDSHSYRNISCDSLPCQKLASVTGKVVGCTDSNCLYRQQYSESTYSVGIFARDKLTLTPTDVVDDFLFGCGENNHGDLGGTAGLLSLGRSPLSLVSQTAQKFGKVFSYCLPSTGSNGYLTFGRDDSKEQKVKYTQSPINMRTPTYHFVNMLGISVGGQRLSIPASVFTNAGTILASGAVISRLPPTAYSALQNAFMQQMTQYKRVDGVFSFDTCYDFSPYSVVSVPSIVLHFSADMEMSLYGLGIVNFVGGSKICLAFAANSDDSAVGIIGSVQQRRFHVVFDDAQGRVGIARDGCD